MDYIDGFVVPVPAENREAYRALAAKVAPLFMKHGAKRLVECWGDDVPDGKVTDFRGAVKAKEGEVVVFSWIAWPDKATRDAGMAAFREDPEIKMEADMPFDGQRMIFGGFETIVDEAG
ncbi:MAG: DUF1428 domain-containing protein [Aurantimonas endophytica]|jgi:uncharacterized protein YbaA (DUF1428 family)|uniref:Uncharacterized protein YbaA (DUF1428 family) n=1 Tax=Aurantimonas endophytica TaxID=1522175 RepID=A0A7W6MRU3_9HYPH|nr:DUF1428 domain-containing protein [Aurantimonas endophytica]MBB4005343.1 uncharacterized protein YbaA (DUF1428 family) [Aurantimonas endophytica]MCO6405996.1 DUF1428 family protein [Aurantimonas endophytica]